ncbi:MAG: sulfite exporter TauE/SafE family protein, partial [Methanomethylophilus sp.]|nr:sulfite exporter TauE/SafE family protein [Methanomethylophilus sp.]
MDPALLMVLMLIAIGAGIVGALFGLGGGIIFIPVLTILFGLDAAEAVAASLVGIVATSTGSATGFVKKGLSNIRLGMLLEITTTIGAIIGAIIASYLENWILLILFSMVMLYSGFKMAVSPERTDIGEGRENELTFEYSD